MRVFYICLLSLSIYNLYAQSDIINSPFLISSSGETLIQDNYNLCFSLGEIAIETFSQEDIILTQGFHQEDYTITYISEILENYRVEFYPNPTKDILYVNCNIAESVDLQLKDPKGSVILSFFKISGNETQALDLSTFSQGVYFLELGFNNSTNQIYQIQKFN